MSDHPSYSLSVSDLFAEREAARRREQEDAGKLKQHEHEQDIDLKKRLDRFKMTDEVRAHFINRIKAAFARGDNEWMVVSFPSRICSDEGRAVDNSDVPPINKSKSNGGSDDDPAWLSTLPAGAHELYRFYRESLKSGGFHFEARVINYPNGMPGDIGIFFTWPRNELDATN